MKILITGGAGFIGANLVHYLVRETHHELLVLDKLTYAGNRASLESVENEPRFGLQQVDLVDARALKQAIETFQPNAVMHLAAESHVDRSIDGPAAFVNTNVMGTFNLLQAITEHWQALAEPNQTKFRFLHVSTDEVYGSLNASDPPFTEQSCYQPSSPYSATKAASDHLVKAWGTTYGLPILVTNCSNNYGPYQFPEKLIPVVILRALKGEPIPVYGAGDNVRDWLHVEDHCQGLRVVLEKGEPGHTYNIGGDQEMSNLALVKSICAVLDELSPRSNGKKHADSIDFVADRPGHDFRYAIDSTKIREQLQWHPQRSFERGLRATVEWYLKNKCWWESILDGSYRLERMGTASA